VREPSVLLLDMRAAIDDVLSFVTGGRDDFMADRKTQAAVVRCLEIIGEASKGLPDSFRAQAPHIPWKRLAGLRDVLAHAYHRVDLELVWEVVDAELLGLREQIAQLLEDEA